MLTALSLVRKGYVPKEVPPAFTTEPLADLYADPKFTIPTGKQPTCCVRHNLARSSGHRRPLKLPNPVSYIPLCEEIEAVWGDIDAFLKTGDLALSRPEPSSSEEERAVKPHAQITQEPVLRAQLWRGQKFVMRADVNQFYSSLYTHSIPWALHGKKSAKEKKGKTEADRLDRAVRNCESAQTSGIPIGPDASLVLAEIVLTAVDLALQERIPGLRCFRYFDDYEAAFATRSDAERAQGLLEGILADFELTVNPAKTYVVELPQPFKTTWTQELQAFQIRTGKPREVLHDVLALFSRAAEVASRHPGALTYALRKSREIPMHQEYWDTFQALVWSAVSAEPTTMAVALDLLKVKADEVKSTVDVDGAGEALESLIQRNAPVRNASEVAWALWAAIQLQVELSTEAAVAVAEVEDDFVALLALDADARGRFPAGALDSSTWEELIDDAEVLSGDHWLLAYEGTLKGWLSTAQPQVQGHEFFSELLAHQVAFYDENPERDPFTGPAGPLGSDDYGDAPASTDGGDSSEAPDAVPF